MSGMSTGVVVSLAGERGAKTEEQLRSETRAVKTLSRADREAMWRLFGGHYVDVDRRTFETDLAEKNHAILLRDSKEGKLRGFTTLLRYCRSIEGQTVGVVFSGDTVVDRRYWGQKALHRAFFRYVLAHKLRHALIPVYWFLLCKGYRTYLLLARSFVEHWPRFDRVMPREKKKLIDKLASDRFGQAYRPTSGLVRFVPCRGRLRPEVAPIDEQMRLCTPEIRFFEGVNPRHAQGDELCCLGLIDFRQLTYYLGKLARRRLRRRRQSKP
jgi:hypothetical protein